MAELPPKDQLPAYDKSDSWFVPCEDITAPVPPGYPELPADAPGGRLYLPREEAAGLIRYDGFKFTTDGTPRRVWHMELPLGHETHSPERAAFLADPAQCEQYLLPVVTAEWPAPLSAEQTQYYLDRGYVIFDQFGWPIPGDYQEVSRNLSHMIYQKSVRVGMPLGAGRFPAPGDNPEVRVFLLMPRSQTDDRLATLMLGVPQAESGAVVWEPAGGIPSKEDKIRERYSPIQAAARLCLEQTGIDIKNFKISHLVTHPVTGPDATLHARRLVTNILVSLPYSRELAAQVSDEIPTGADAIGPHWLDVRRIYEASTQRHYIDDEQGDFERIMDDLYLFQLGEAIARHEKSSPKNYDAYISVAGPDRPLARQLINELRDKNIRVFYDEDIDTATSVNDAMKEGLKRSDVVVALYSEAFPTRAACQYEITYAYIAGEAEDDPYKRLIILNPHEDSDHLMPNFGDPKYLKIGQLPNVPWGENYARIFAAVLAIENTLKSVEGQIGDFLPTQKNKWYNHVEGTREEGIKKFERYFETFWQIHGALTALDLPLTTERTTGRIAWVDCDSTIDLEGLVGAYAWRFGMAYPGGVYWANLNNQGGSTAEVLERYTEELRDIAKLIKLDGARGMDRAELLGSIAHHLDTQGQKSLWIVNGLPADLDPAVAHKLVVPSSHISTILAGKANLASVVTAVYATEPPITFEGLRDIHDKRIPGAEFLP